MQMHLDTIPLWDSFRAGGECPLCSLSRYLEEQFLDGTLGGAAMEPAIRIMSNELGYCRNHFHALFHRQQRLPLALITSTHLSETTGKLAPLMNDVMDPEKKQAKKGLFSSRSQTDPLDQLITELAHRDGSCMICKRIETNMARYMQTAASLYAKDQNFADLYAAGQGFCLPHLKGILTHARTELKGAVAERFVKDTLTMQLKAQERLEDELKHFTAMFDYRNNGEDWGTSRDALPRVIAKLRGEPRPDEA